MGRITSAIERGLGTGVVSGASAALLASAGNAMGPTAGIDPGMSQAERAAAVTQYAPTNPVTAGLVVGAVGAGLRMHHLLRESQGFKKAGK